MKNAALRQASKPIGILIVDGLFFGSLSPRQTPAILIIIGFLLLVATIYIVLDPLLGLAERVYTFPEMTRHRLRLSVTMLLALLLAMQSIGQLTFRDLGAIVPLVIVAAFYLSYQRKQAS